MDLGIAGKWALVCGSSKGLGYGCSRALMLEGVNIVLVARNKENLQNAYKNLEIEKERQTYPFNETQIISVVADITTDAGRSSVFEKHSCFDIIVTNAGGPPPGNFRQWNQDTWIQAIKANMLTPIELIRHSVDGMIEREFGRIINITSSAVKSAIDILGLSNGARSGLTGFVAGLARESNLASHNVTINNLLPGMFNTERIMATIKHSAQENNCTADQILVKRQNSIPARRLGSPSEFGAMCAFLCSQYASYITGQNILIDGGAYPGTY